MQPDRRLAADIAAELVDVVYVLRLEPDQAFEFVSPSVTDLVGYTPDEHYADPGLGWRLLDPRDLPVLLGTTAAEVGEVVDFTVRWIGKDGRTVWTQHRCRKVRRDDGSVALYGAARDVSAAREAQEALARAEARYRMLVENSTDVVVTGDGQGRLTWVSESVSDLLGWTAGDLVGQRIADLVHPADLSTAQGVHAGLMRGEPGRMEVRLSARDGGYRWTSILVRPVRDEAGDVVGGVAGLHDVDDLVVARQQARQAAEHRAAVLDSMLDPHVLLTAVRDDSGGLVDFEYTDANPAACASYRVPRDRVIGARVRDLLPAHAASGLLAAYVHTIETGEPLVLDDFEYVGGASGGSRWFDLRGVKVSDALSYTWRDVTYRHEAARQLAESEERYRTIATNTLDVVIQCSPDAVVRWVSPSVTETMGWPVEDLIGRSLAELVEPEDLTRGRAALVQVLRNGVELGEVELRYRTRDGRWRWMRTIGRVLRDGADHVSGYIVTLRDIQTEVDTRRRLDFEVSHDSLTGLGNRDQLLAALQRCTAGSRCALCCLGVDDLGEINDAFTHHAGDLALVSVADALVGAGPDPGRVFRTGDNEFTVLLDVDGAGDALLEEVTRLQRLASRPIKSAGQSVDVTVSAGIATGTPADAVELLRDASTALRRARARGRRRWEFADPALSAQAQDRLRVRSGLTRALDEDQIHVWYQPVVTLPAGHLVGYEALARWITDDGTVVPPDAFIPVAEQSGLIAALDHHVCDLAVASLARQPADLHIAVNLSAATLTGDGLVERITRHLATYRVDPHRLHLEVTETALLDVTGQVRAAMQTLAARGVTWWVDDFGTGYSSVSHLRDLPVQGLKLDRSFTHDITGPDPTPQRLAHGLAGLARGLGLATVAEGVETQAEADLLAAQGWSYGQGWLYGRPGPL